MSRYVDISHFRAPYKNAVLQGLGAFGQKSKALIAGPYRSFPWAQLAGRPLWIGQQQVIGDKWSGNQYIGDIMSISSKPTGFAKYNFDYAPTMVWLKSRVAMGYRVYVNVGQDEVRVAVSHVPGNDKWMLGSSLATPDGKIVPWQDVTSTLKWSSGSMQGLGAPEDVLYYTDANPRGGVRVLTDITKAALQTTMAGLNPSLPNGVLVVTPYITTDLGSSVNLVVVSMETAKSGQFVWAAQWIDQQVKAGNKVSIAMKDNSALDLTPDALSGGRVVAVSGKDEELLAGPKAVSADGKGSSAMWYGYTPVKAPSGGGGGGEEPSKAGIGPLGIATIAVVVVGLGYLALKKKKPGE